MKTPNTLRALTCAWAAALAMTPALGFAHGDEDHSQDKKPVASAAPMVSTPIGSEAPARLPDGSVFMPKASQNLLAIRTTRSALGNVNQTIELKGRVKADPAAGGQVQASQMGRIVTTAAGLPSLGQAVKAGQILAWLEPVVGSVERGNQQAQLAQIQSELAQAERKVQRYMQLEGSIPQKEIDTARSELQALTRQKAALSGGLSTRLPLIAPASGAISNVAVVAGQVVEARETLFNIVNPQRLIIEALGYDARLIGNIATVSGSTEAGAPLKLTLLGTGLELREQALPIHLRVTQPAPALAVGQPVKVFVQLSEQKRGVVVPMAAVSRAPSGEPIVWVHAAAERFIPHKVQTQSLDAGTLVVTHGLDGAERVVVQGVSSLAQVR